MIRYKCHLNVEKRANYFIFCETAVQRKFSQKFREISCCTKFMDANQHFFRQINFAIYVEVTEELVSRNVCA